MLDSIFKSLSAKQSMVSTNSIFAEAAKNTSNALLNKENTQSILNKLATLLANPSLTDAERAALQKEYDYYNNAYSNASNQYNTSINDENNIRKSQSELNLDKFGGYSKDFDLGLGGHSHNGQIQIPFFGSFHKKEGSLIYSEPYYKNGNADIYISNGIGTTDYQFRFFNRPSINLFRLVNK